MHSPALVTHTKAEARQSNEYLVTAIGLHSSQLDLSLLAHLLYQRDPEYRAPHLSWQSPHSCQIPAWRKNEKNSHFNPLPHLLSIFPITCIKRPFYIMKVAIQRDRERLNCLDTLIVKTDIDRWTPPPSNQLKWVHFALKGTSLHPNGHGLWWRSVMDGQKASKTHRGDVLLRELVGCVGNEQTGLTHGAVAYHHTLYGLHHHWIRTDCI